jgi:concanavalin A-like lectin/glucanase superfamily protein/uncharacterized protein DUF2341/Calx-beta domain-containing protein/putative pyrroloquinoline-quinone-binding quinoprotein
VQNNTQGFSTATRARIATVADANCLIATERYLYHSTDSELIKTERASQKTVWAVPSTYPYALILAGELLIAGGDGELAAFNTDGERVWASPADGKVYGLAVANGAVYASTDKGSILCFRADLPAVRNEDSAVDVKARSAVVQGTLISQGASPAEAELFWGVEDGGDDPARWASHAKLGKRSPGPLRSEMAKLKADTTYYYRYRAKNAEGDAWAPASGMFSTSRVTVRAFRTNIEEGGMREGGFTVTRSGEPSADPLAVEYRVAGTASAGTDYEALSGSVTIPAGEVDAAILVTALDDLTLNEDDENVEVALESGAYVVGSERKAVITIADQSDLSAWAHRMRITFTGYEKAEALNGFPVLIRLNKGLDGLSFGQFKSPEGGDLRFTNADGTQLLPFEIEEWNPEGDTLVWVQIPKLKGTDVSIWAYWGNAQAKSPGAVSSGAAWSANFDGVWHFAETEGEVADSTIKGNNGTPSGGLARGVAGRVGRSARFDGIDDLVTLTEPLATGSSDGTVSAWVKVPKVGSGGLKAGQRVGILLGNCPSKPMSNWEIHADGCMRTYWNGGKIDVKAATDLRDDAWHHLAWTRDKTTNVSRMYIDGRLDKEIPNAGADITFPDTHKIGGDNRGKVLPAFHGLIDELRVSKAARSADWLWACWKNQSAPGDFATYAPVERVAAQR